MKRERIKSFLLGILVIMNFMLGSKILIDKKLWPSGYNFFSNRGGFDIFGIYNDIRSYFSDREPYKGAFLSPARIIINTGDQTTRISLISSDNAFRPLFEEAAGLCAAVFSSDKTNPVKAGREELEAALISDSVYFDFSCSLSPSLAAELFGIKENSALAGIGEISDIVIVHSPRTVIYAGNVSKGNIYKIQALKNDREFTETVSSALSGAPKDGPVINYSFELKFDQPFGEQKTTLDPMIQITSSVPPINALSSKNPVFSENGTVNETAVDGILKVFKINPNTMRRYTEAGGTLVFVENDAILKLYREGILEYTAMGGGMNICDSDAEYARDSAVSQIALNIMRAAGNDKSIAVVKSGLAPEDRKETLFDYTAGGLPVVFSDGAAVSASVSGGELKSYRQIIKSYSYTGEEASPSEFFSSLDNFIADYSKFMNEIYIEKMYIGYSEQTGASKLNADWIVSVDNVIAGE